MNVHILGFIVISLPPKFRFKQLENINPDIGGGGADESYVLSLLKIKLLW